MPLSAWWLVAAVLLAPLAAFPVSTGVSIAQAKNAVLIMLGLGVVVWRVPNVWLQGLAALALLSSMLAGLGTWSVAGLLGVLAWLLIFSEVSRLPDQAWRVLRWAIALAALGQLAWMAMQTAGVDPIFRPIGYRGEALSGPVPAIGWFSNPMDTALFLGLSLPALAALSPWLLLPGALAIWSLSATVGLAGLAAAALWAAPSWRWRAGVAIALLLGGAWFLAIRDTQGAGLRPAIWRNAAQLAWSGPVLGWGPNAVGYRLQTTHQGTRERMNFIFNEWLQGALELGLAGPALALGYLGSLAWRLRRRWRAAGEAVPAALALVVVSCFSIPLRIGPTALLAALYLGRLEAVAQEGS